MSADASTTPPDATPKQGDVASRVVFAVLALNAANAFAWQAWMTYGFAAAVPVPVPLRFALILALDLFAVMYMILTYLLRGSGWPRFAVTVVFLFAVAAQMYAAELFAAHQGWSAPVRLFAALPAVILATAQEGAILWRTHRGRAARRAADRLRQAAAAAEAAAAADDRDQLTAELAAARRAATAAAVPPPPPPAGRARRAKQRRADHTGDPRRADVIKRCLDANPREDAKHVAADLGVNPRTAQLWVKGERERRAVTSRGVMAPGVQVQVQADTVSDAPVPKENSANDVASKSVLA